MEDDHLATDTANKRRRGPRGWWRRQPIERKLPLAFTSLIAILALFYTVTVYREGKRSASVAALIRLDEVGRQISDLAARGNDQRASAIQTLSDTTSPANLVKLLGTQSPVMLLDSAMNAVDTRGSVSDAALAELHRAAAAMQASANTGRVGRLMSEGGHVRYWMIVPVRDEAGRRVMFAELREMKANEKSSRALESLIGATTPFLVNHDFGGPWVRVEGGEVKPPEIRPESTSSRYVRDGVEYLMHATPVPGGDWAVVTETPASATSGRAAAFAGRTLLFTAGFVVLGGLLSWLIGHRITRPIRQMAEAANDIGSGEYRRRVMVREGGDLEMLARAFNKMAAEVERSRDELDHRVQQRTRELQQVNEELQAFSYSVSHDLRSPLRSIDGFSQALLEDYGPKLDATAHDYLTRLRGGAQRMGFLIDDLLLLSRVARQPLDRREVDVSAMARDLVQELRDGERARAIDVTIEDGLRVNADAGLLRIALQNLIGNAWKFTSHTDNARVVIGRTEPENGAEPEIYVRDNGAGFDMAYADQLFAPFQRLHASKDFAGTGIGLATVQRVVTRHGGRVRAESTVGNGATFFFTIDERQNGDARNTAG
jgi:signal transduction histidine kinase